MSCENEREKNLRLDEVLITNIGSYFSPLSGLTLDVFKEGKKINYTLTDDEGKYMLKSKNQFLHYQKWAFYFDSSGVLWVYSSDVGTSIWMKDSKGVYIEENIRSKIIPASPKALNKYGVSVPRK